MRTSLAGRTLTRLYEPPLNKCGPSPSLREFVPQCPLRRSSSSLSPYFRFLYDFTGPFFFCLARSTAEVKARLWGSRDMPFFC